MKKQLTLIEDILFHCSSIGILVGGLTRQGLTEKMQLELDELEAKRKTPIGLSEKQLYDLNKWDAKISDKETLSQTQMVKRDDYRLRLTKCKELSSTQEAKRQDYIRRKDLPPTLSIGAKKHVEKLHRELVYHFREEIDSKQMRKGKQSEEDAIKLMSFVDNYMYVNNNNRPNSGRLTKDNLTGACDVITHFDEIKITHDPKNGTAIIGCKKENEGETFIWHDVTVIDDAKCSWNTQTFQDRTFNTIDEWQLRSYMYLYDANLARLRPCLVDCPPDVFEDEYKKFRTIHRLRRCDIEDLVAPKLLDMIDQCQIPLEALIDMFGKDDIPKEYIEYKRIIDQFYNNHFFENTGYYTQKERIKTFVIDRDYELEETMKTAVKLGVEYFNTIHLNGISI